MNQLTQCLSGIHSKSVVTTKFLISLIVILFGFSLYGQSSDKKIIKDSTKIEIIGESVYRVHQEIYVKKDSGWARSDSTWVRTVKLLCRIFFSKNRKQRF